MSAVLDLQTHPLEDDQVLAPLSLTLIESTSWGLRGVPATQMPIAAILVSPNGDGKAADLDGLVASIRKRGVLQPLVVAPDGRLLAGRRRLAAARRAGLTTVPVRVCEIETERAAIEIGLIENVERADLDPLTRAKSYHALIEQGASVEEIARLVGQGTGHVYQHLQLFELHPDVQHALHTRTLSFADARALVPLEPEDQASVLQEICSSPKPLSSRQVKLRVDARRVMRLVRSDEPGTQKNCEVVTEGSQNSCGANELAGNYGALFESQDTPTVVEQPDAGIDPLDQLDALIAEMVSAAQGEDQVRAWARRLSRILAELGMLKAECGSKKKSPSAVQDRLL
jgi:ParB/RepB/Spo0J family partition protein